MLGETGSRLTRVMHKWHMVVFLSNISGPWCIVVWAHTRRRRNALAHSLPLPLFCGQTRRAYHQRSGLERKLHTHQLYTYKHAASRDDARTRFLLYPVQAFKTLLMSAFSIFGLCRSMSCTLKMRSWTQRNSEQLTKARKATTDKWRSFVPLMWRV